VKMLGANAPLDTFYIQRVPKLNETNSVLAWLDGACSFRHHSSPIREGGSGQVDTLLWTQSALPARVRLQNSRILQQIPAKSCTTLGKLSPRTPKRGPLHSGQISNLKHTAQPRYKRQLQRCSAFLGYFKRSCTDPSWTSRKLRKSPHTSYNSCAIAAAAMQPVISSIS
jgi:hypothetical protein